MFLKDFWGNFCLPSYVDTNPDCMIPRLETLGVGYSPGEIRRETFV